MDIKTFESICKSCEKDFEQMGKSAHFTIGYIEGIVESKFFTDSHKVKLISVVLSGEENARRGN